MMSRKPPGGGQILFGTKCDSGLVMPPKNKRPVIIVTPEKWQAAEKLAEWVKRKFGMFNESSAPYGYADCPKAVALACQIVPDKEDDDE